MTVDAKIDWCARRVAALFKQAVGPRGWFIAMELSPRFLRKSRMHQFERTVSYFRDVVFWWQNMIGSGF